jgi:hypothetical protein
MGDMGNIKACRGGIMGERGRGVRLNGESLGAFRRFRFHNKQTMIKKIRLQQNNLLSMRLDRER